MDEMRSAAELSDALSRLGVEQGAAAPGASVGGLTSLMRAARFRLTLESHAAQMRTHSAARAALRPSGAAAANGGGGGGRETSAAGREWQTRLPVVTDESDRGGAPLAAECNVADRMLVDALEAQLVDVMAGCGEVVSLLIAELEQAHRLARGSNRGSTRVGGGVGDSDRSLERRTAMSFVTAPTVTAPPPEQGAVTATGTREQGALRDERARAVRRSRANLCGQHDLLSQLIACRVDHGPSL